MKFINCHQHPQIVHFEFDILMINPLKKKRKKNIHQQSKIPLMTTCHQNWSKIWFLNKELNHWTSIEMKKTHFCSKPKMVALVLRLCVLSNVQPLCSSNHPSCNQKPYNSYWKFSKIFNKRKRKKNPFLQTLWRQIKNLFKRFKKFVEKNFLFSFQTFSFSYRFSVVLRFQFQFRIFLFSLNSINF